MVSERDTESDPVHWLDLGPDPDLNSHRSQPPRWRWWSGLVVALVAALLVARNQQGGPSLAEAGQAAAPGPPPPAAGPPAAGPAGAGSSTVTAIDLGRPLLDVPADWELFGQGHVLAINRAGESAVLGAQVGRLDQLALQTAPR